MVAASYCGDAFLGILGESDNRKLNGAKYEESRRKTLRDFRPGKKLSFQEDSGSEHI